MVLARNFAQDSFFAFVQALPLVWNAFFFSSKAQFISSLGLVAQTPYPILPTESYKLPPSLDSQIVPASSAGWASSQGWAL